MDHITVNVSILDNQLEDFVATLALQTDNNRVLVNPNTAQVEMVDNDGKDTKL
jgi:hypothetical protein